jgi:hypothetical protein
MTRHTKKERESMTHLSAAKRVLVGGLLSMLAAACGSDSPTAPSIAQVSGVWTGRVTQSSAIGGECVGLYLATFNGASEAFTASITQTGSSLTATASSQGGTSCAYTGTAGEDSVALNATTCQISILQIQCANGAQRDIQRISQSVTGRVNGNTMTGTVGESWNVYVRGGTTNSLGILVVNNTFTLNR